MIWIVLTLITLTLIVLFLKLSKKSNALSHQHSYDKQDALFSPTERSFLGVLNQAIEDNAFVFGKVRVADVLKPSKGGARNQWQSAFNKINSKHFDFVLCDKNDLSVLCAIERIGVRAQLFLILERIGVRAQLFLILANTENPGQRAIVSNILI